MSNKPITQSDKTNIWFEERVFSKKFASKTKQSAYLSACKWLGENIVSKQDELCEVSYTIEDTSASESPSYTLHIFLKFSENELREKTCKACKEYSSLFYIRGYAEPCNSCKALAYINRMDDAMKKRKSIYGYRLKAIIGGKR